MTTYILPTRSRWTCAWVRLMLFLFLPTASIQGALGAPEITGFTPTSTYPGAVVTITGTQFTGATAITFHGTPPLCWTVDSDTQITAVVPRGATSGPINLTTPGGTAASADDFNVVPAGQGMIVFMARPSGSWYMQIHTIKPNGTGLRSITNSAASNYSPVISPDGSKIAYTSYRNGVESIYTINTDGTGETRLDIGLTTVYDVTWSPDGRKIAFYSYDSGYCQIYIVNADGSGLTQVTQTETDEISPSFTPDGKRIIFQSYRGDTTQLYSINIDGTSETRIIEDEDDYDEWVLSPDGSKIAYVNSYWDDEAWDWIYSLNVINADGTGQTCVMRNELEPESPSFSPDGRRICFTADYNDETAIYAIDVDGGPPILVAYSEETGYYSPSWGGGPLPSPMVTEFSPGYGYPGVPVTIAGENFSDVTAVRFNGTPAVCVMIDSDMQLTAVVPLGATTGPISVVNGAGTATTTENFIVIPPGEGKIAFWSYRDNNYEIYSMDADGANQTRLTVSPSIEGWPAISPDGRKIAYVSNSSGNNEIYVMNTNGSGQTRLTDNDANDYSPVFSPDGRRIAFVSDRDGQADIYTINVNGTDVRRLTTNGRPVSSLAFSPDGKKIAFAGFNNPDWDIYLMNANGSEQVSLTTGAGSNQYPVIAPGGHAIFFTSTRAGGVEIYRMNIDGSGQTRLTTTGVVNQYLAVSPNGQKIAFTSSRDGHEEIYVMNANGSGQTRLTNNPEGNAWPSWGGMPGMGPSILNFSPGSGMPGTAVTITGQNFSDVHLLEFNGMPSRYFVIDSSTQITAVVPVEATTGLIAMQTPFYAITSTNNFIVNTTDQGRIVFVSSGDGEGYYIYKMNVDGSDRTNLTSTGGGNDHLPCLSPDGRKIVFLRRDETIGQMQPYLMNSDGSNPHRIITQENASFSSVSFSPDGRQILFAGGINEAYGIYQMNIDGTGLTTICIGWNGEEFPTFSPDGKKIAYCSYEYEIGAYGLYIMDRDGSNRVRLATAGNANKPSFSPDGQKIVFTGVFGQGYYANLEICVVNTDGTGFTRLTNSGGLEMSPAFSPDGQRIVFSSVWGQEYNTELYVMNADGSQQVRLTANGVADKTPSWGGSGIIAPGATEDNYTVNEDTMLTIAAPGVLVNDSGSGQLTAVKVSDPSHGTLTLNGDGSFSYQPEANYNGPDSFEYKVTVDTFASLPVTVSLTINAVNDPPSFTKGANIRVRQTAGAQTITGWATNISPGPADESAQTVAFLVATDHPEYFTAVPAISATGTLTFTPNPTASGTATVTVRLRDNAGGADTSAAQMFTIAVCAPLSGVNLALDPYEAGPTYEYVQVLNATAINGLTPEYTFQISLQDVQADGSIVTRAITPVSPPTGTYASSGRLVFTPTEPGTYTVTVFCREEGTNPATPFKKTLTYFLRTDALTTITTLAVNQASGIALSDIPASGIQLSAVIAGNGTGVSYFFSGTVREVQPDGTIDQVPVSLSTEWGGNAFAWHPIQPGIYTLKVMARDASYNVSYSKTLVFTVASGALKSIASFTAEPDSGVALGDIPASGIHLTAVPNGSGSEVEYFFSGQFKDIRADGSYTWLPVTLSTDWGVNTFAWHPTTPGIYNLTVTGRDPNYGTTAAKTLTFTVKSDALRNIVSFTADPGSGIKITEIPGDGIQLTATPDGTGAGVEYFFSGQFKDFQANGSYVMVPVTLSTAWGGDTCAWHPSAPGTYVLMVTARTADYDVTCAKTLSFTVASGNLVRLASFTANPSSGVALGDISTGGIELTATPEGTGDGVQYFFSAQFKDMQADGSSTLVPVTLSTEWAGNTYTWRPTVSGTYILKVIAREGSYDVTYAKILTFVVLPDSLKGIASFVANPTSGVVQGDIPTGGIQLTATPEGTGIGVQYFFSGKLKVISANGSVSYETVAVSTTWGGNSFAWHPTEPGTYLLTVTARDAAYDTVCTKTLTFAIVANSLKSIASFTANIPSGVALGDIPAGGIELTATPEGSGAGVEYFFSGKMRNIAADGSYTDETVTLSTVWGGNSFVWHPTEPGTYTLMVTARDATYMTRTKTLTFTVHADGLKSIASFTATPPSGTLSVDTMPTGGITLTAVPEGSGAGVQYFFSARLKNVQADGRYTYDSVTLSTSWGGNTFVWHPTEPGTYLLMVSARDASFNANVYAIQYYTIKADSLKDIASFTASPGSGVAVGDIPTAGIQLTATPLGSGIGVEYFFSGKRKNMAADGSYIYETVTLSTAWGGDTFAWHPTVPGTYILMVTARTANYDTTYKKTLTFTVSADSLKSIASVIATPASGVALGEIPEGGIQLTATPQGSGDGVEYFFSGRLKDIQEDGTYTYIPVTLSTGWGGDTFAWHPTEPGTYTLTVTARDASYDTSSSKSITFIVKASELKGILSFSADQPSGTSLDAMPTDGITFTAVPDGAGTDVQYFFSGKYKDIRADGSSVDIPVTLSTGWGGNTFAWCPTEVGTYTLTVTARDVTYNTSYSKSVTFIVRSPALKGITSFTPNPKSGISLAAIPPSGVQFTAVVNGTGENVQYRYKVGQLINGSYVFGPLTADTTTNSFDFLPTEIGSYQVWVYAYDETFNTSASKSANFVVK